VFGAPPESRLASNRVSKRLEDYLINFFTRSGQIHVCRSSTRRNRVGLVGSPFCCLSGKLAKDALQMSRI